MPTLEERIENQRASIEAMQANEQSLKEVIAAQRREISALHVENAALTANIEARKAAAEKLLNQIEALNKKARTPWYQKLFTFFTHKD